MATLLIKNCNALLPNGITKCDILCVDGSIKDIAITSLSLPDSKTRTDNIINADGNLVMPGAIDCHVHVREPGQEHKETWQTASMAAAHGGVTSIFDMPNNKVPITTLDLLKEKLSIAKSNSIVNYAAYLGLSNSHISEIEKANAAYAVANNGFCGFKLYMAKTTGELNVLKENDQDLLLSKTAKTGKITVVHAEDQELNDKAYDKFNRNINKNKVERRKDYSHDYSHSESRPRESEISAVNRALRLSKKHNNKIHFAHLSTKESIDFVSRAKTENTDCSCEATLLHITLDSNAEKRLKSRVKINPPLRSRADREYIIGSLANGKIDFVATDHAPHTIEEKEKDVMDAPSGVPTLDHYFPVLLDLMNKNLFSLDNLWKLTSHNPAKRFNVMNKARLANGYDADIVILDTKKIHKASDDDVFTKCGWTPFNGMKFKGSVKATIVNGCVAYNNEAPNKKCAGKAVEFGKA